MAKLEYPDKIPPYGRPIIIIATHGHIKPDCPAVVAGEQVYKDFLAIEPTAWDALEWMLVVVDGVSHSISRENVRFA